MVNGITIGENYFYNNDPENIDSIVEAMVDALVRKLRINNLQLTDELSQYFEIVAIPDSEEDGPKFSIANDGKTFNVTDIELNSNDPAEGEEPYYSWSTTILVKAEEAFVGADVVPTNIGASSGIKIPEMETMQPFETVDGDGREYDLATPYVDVKLHAPIPIETNETILLNQAAKGIDEITEGWHEKIWKSEHDHKDIEHKDTNLNTEVSNTPKGLLPSTGGNGILLFLAIGLGLMAGAFVWYKKVKRTVEV